MTIYGVKEANITSWQIKTHVSIILTRCKNLYVTKALEILYSKIHKRGKEDSLSYSENPCRVLLVMTKKKENLELSLLSSYGGIQKFWKLLIEMIQLQQVSLSVFYANRGKRF